MAVKVHFEVGHTSKLKSKKTPDGYTHDWELYVRGTEKNDISHFVDKVVYNLHESFPRPKRVVKEAPFILKESGYAGFMVPTEIHFKNRDMPKVMTFTYDLSLQQSGPPAHRSEIKKFTFNSPSDEFRRKLLKGGGISLLNNSDEKSRDSLDERAQLLNKPKLSIDDAKKHKIRPDESKLETFAKLFGPPITKAPSKVSPDAKNKASPSITPTMVGSKSNKISEKSSSSASSSSALKSEKTDKKDKHKHSPHKEKYEAISKDNKKTSSEDKHDRRDEKKNKSHSKERGRSRDKTTKRPPSPKRLPSPKRPSPVRSSSAASRGEDTNGYKMTSAKSHTETVGINNNNNAEKVSTSTSGSSSNKKAKKEKKSYDKDRDREKKDKDRDRKEKDNYSTPIVAPSILNHAATINTKLPNSDVKLDYSKVEKAAGTAGSSKEIKEPKKSADLKIADTNNLTMIDKKSTDKHDKDAEKRHKHKKKDKNKEKEKEKEYSSSKDNKKKDKSVKKDELKKTPQSSSDPPATLPQKSSTNALNTLLRGISDDDSHDSITESASASISERPESFAESSNSSMPDMINKQAIIPHVVDDSKSDKKERKSRDKVKVEKDEKKRKRKSKDEADISSQSRKSTSPAINLITEPPLKQSKKDELIMKNGDRSNSPHLSHTNSNVSNSQPLPPQTQQLSSTDDSKAFRAPTSASVPIPSTSSNSSSSQSSVIHHHHHPQQQQSQQQQPQQQQPQLDRSLTVDYMSELRDLQQKIMTLQDNNELQQVVEMIAATGRFEVTSKTFDFDLCALDRNTVQKLQDFFATSCS